MIHELSPQEWGSLSEDAHKVVFQKNLSRDSDKVSFALLYGNGEKPMGYLTCIDMGNQVVYLKYGGVFPAFRGKGYPMKLLNEAFKSIKARGFSEMYTLIENTNQVMIRIYLALNFVIRGVIQRNGQTLVELYRKVDSSE